MKPPRLKTQSNTSQQLIVNPQVPVFCQLWVCACSNSCPWCWVSCPWFSMCLFGRCWSTERSFDFASLSCQKPSSSLFICCNITITFINPSLFSMIILLKTCFSHSLMTITHRGRCFCLCWVFLHLETFRWALRSGVAWGGTRVGLAVAVWQRPSPHRGGHRTGVWGKSWSCALRLKFLVCFCSRSWLWLPSQNTKDGLFGSKLPKWRLCLRGVLRIMEICLP